MRAVLLAAVLPFAGTAQTAPPYVEYSGGGEPASVAGTPATVTEIGEATGIFFPYLNNLVFYERGDEPCAVAEEPRNQAPEYLWDGCEGARRSPQRLEVFAPSPRFSSLVRYETVQLPTGRTGRILTRDRPGDSYEPHGLWSLQKIRVCTNGRSGIRGQLVKGVEAAWSANPYDAADQQHTERRSFARPNCDADEWSAWSSCPAGTAAPVVRLHHKAVGGRRGLVGIQLVCYTASER